MRVLPLLAFTMALAGCGKHESAKPIAASPPQPAAALLAAPSLPSSLAPQSPQSPQSSQATPSSQATQSPPESPVVCLATANGAVRTEVFADWPVVVEVHVLLKPGSSAITLASPSGPWTDALTLECRDADGVDKSSLFARAFPANTSIDLTHERSGVMVWILAGAAPSALREGVWQIRAVLDEKKLGGVLPPGITSSRVEVVVAPAARALTPRAAQRKCLAVMTAAAWENNLEKALAAADVHLASNAEDVAVLFMKGQILNAQGKKELALASFEASRRAANVNPEKMAENFAIDEAILELRRAPK